MALERGIPDYWIWLLGDWVKWSLFDPTTWGFLLGTIAVGVLVVFVTGMLLRYPVKADPFDPEPAHTAQVR